MDEGVVERGENVCGGEDSLALAHLGAELGDDLLLLDVLLSRRHPSDLFLLISQRKTRIFDDKARQNFGFLHDAKWQPTRPSLPTDDETNGAHKILRQNIC